MSNVFAVVTSDTVDLSQPARKLWVGVTGDIAVALADITGSVTGSITIKAVPAAGWWSPGDGAYRITRVYATGTTATNLVAFA